MPSEVVHHPEALKRTALYPLHVSLGAKIGVFGGWELPIYYTSILEEHEAVRKGVGLFDVSHLGHLEVSGPQALEELQPLVTQDLKKVKVGRACYTPMLNSQGAILDEMILYRLEETRFRLVANAANAKRVLSWLKDHLPDPLEVRDLRQEVGTLALQGPRAAFVMGRVSQDPFHELPRYGARSGAVFGKTAWVARTGYTGEDGFELFLSVEDLEPVFKGFLESGRPLGLKPIGLGARDTLRLEAGLPLGGSDLDEATTPLEAGLDWTVSWEKGSFIGREALERQRKEGLSRRLVGFQLKEKGVPRLGYPILHQGRPLGRVTSGTLLPYRGFAIGLGYLPPHLADPGTQVEIEIHGRLVPAEVRKLPFYRRRID